MKTKEERPLVKLNKDKDYGTCHPPHEGALYTQNGFFFDAEGKLCEHLVDDAQRAKLDAIRKEREARAAAKAAYDKAMGGDAEKKAAETKTPKAAQTPAPKPETKPEEPPPGDGEEDGGDSGEAEDEDEDDEFGEDGDDEDEDEDEGEGGGDKEADAKAQAKADVIAWATGKKKIQIHALKKIMREHFNADLGGKDAIVQFLIENGIVKQDQVKV